MNKKHLSVVIPCFNEERNLRLGALEKVAHYLNQQKYSWEVIVVDDGSHDDSVRLIKNHLTEHPGFRLLEKSHHGKASTVSAGVLASGGDYILFTDMDQATPINQLGNLLPQLTKGFDMVIGSRNTDRRGAPLLRLAMARGFMLLRNLILDLGLTDTQCGFKAFTRSAAHNLFPRLIVFDKNYTGSGSSVTAGFYVELLYMAKLRGYKIAEVPVAWTNGPTTRMRIRHLPHIVQEFFLLPGPGETVPTL